MTANVTADGAFIRLNISEQNLLSTLFQNCFKTFWEVSYMFLLFISLTSEIH